MHVHLGAQDVLFGFDVNNVQTEVIELIYTLL